MTRTTSPSSAALRPHSQLITHELRMRALSVRRIIKVTPRLYRVTLGGPDLAGFRSLAPDDHVKVLFPPAGKDRPELPPVHRGQVLWPKDRSGFVARDYTPVRFDAEALTLDLELVFHPHGHASAWLQQATVGAQLGVAGPRGSHHWVCPPRRLWLIGDETALPAIARWLEELPPSSRVHALIEVADAKEERRLSTATNATIHWLHRNGAAPGTTSLLLDTVRQLPRGDALDLIWIAGEANGVQAIRRHVCDERGIPRSLVSARGYWKLGTQDHQEPHDD